MVFCMAALANEYRQEKSKEKNLRFLYQAFQLLSKALCLDDKQLPSKVTLLSSSAKPSILL